MLQKYTALALAMTAAAASANPFAPKPAQSANTKKSEYMSKIVGNAKTLRKLGDYQPDISGYSIQFQKCQFMKQMSVEECDADVGCLETKRLVIFRLCSSCSSCSYNYGEYLIDLDLFLEATVGYYQEEQENDCQMCEEYCQNGNYNYNYGNNNADEDEDAEDEDGGRRRLQDYSNINCNSCVDDCYKIENMEANGYVDATEFLECQEIDQNNDNADAIWAGPMCASSGEKIKIGIFKDELCSTPDSDKDVDDYLVDGDGYQIKLSHNLLKKVYTDSCISCLEVDEDQDDQNADDQEEDEIRVIEACEQLYEDAAKCETEHGFDAGYNYYDIYYNQAAQEDTICGMISQLSSGIFDSSGEIVLNGSKSSNSSSSGGATGGQKFALTVFILATIGLAVWAATLHSKLTKGGNADLSQQGGAMA